MVFEFNRIYIGALLLCIFIISFYYNLDYLILSILTVFIFYDLYNSNFINNFYSFSLIIIFSITLYIIAINYDFVDYINLLLIIFVLLIIFFLNKPNFAQKLIFLGIIIIFIYNFYEIINTNRKIFYFIIFISFYNDTIAYIFGRLIKGPLIVSSISPKKTWSGTLLSIFVSFFTIYYFGYPLIISFLLSLSLFFGDIFFSFIKRINNLKDFSSILKGHGGILDRLDSMFFFLIIMNYYL